MEKEDSYGRIIRIYQNNDAHMSKDNLYLVLEELGLEEDNLENISEEIFDIFEASSLIVSTTVYTKYDENNNLTYLDEETALKEVSELKELQKNNIAQGIATAATYKDSYMKVVYTAAYSGNGAYLFTTDASWLTMPFFRGYDSIGSCAMNATVTNSTRSGYYSFDRTLIVSGKQTTTTVTNNFSSSDFKNAVNGNWYGSAALINLPGDSYENTISTLYDNFKAHYQYQGHVNSPKVESYFNTIGTYSHATLAISVTPSVGINISTGDVSASIGLSVAGSVDTRSAELEIHYKP